MEPELKTEVFPGELVNPSDPRNNFEIEKQRLSKLSLIDERRASNKFATTDFKSEFLSQGN